MYTLVDDGAATLDLDVAVTVDLESPQAVHRWAMKLCCTDAELREAARRVGPDVEDVENYLAAKLYLDSLRGGALRH